MTTDGSFSVAGIDATPPWWMSNAHVQTILPALAKPRKRLETETIRWTTPDGDFIDTVQLDVATPAPVLVLFHGLEGTKDSHYALSFAAEAQRRGWAFVLPHFRGCGGDLNIAPRAYHSGDHAEIDWILRRIKSEAGNRPVMAVGVSLGGNALMRWAGEHGSSANGVVTAAVAISAPLDLTASGHAMGRGFNRQVYTRMFLRTMVPKAMAKWEQYPGLFDRKRLLKAKTLYDFDDAFTAPVHGFRDAKDYWLRASAKPKLKDVATPSLILNARNDPFVPSASLPTVAEVSPAVTLWQPQYGGHVGFPAPTDRTHIGFHSNHMPHTVANWLHCQLQLTETPRGTHSG